MLEKKKLRDIAESISGIRPENRSLEGIVNFIEEQANIVYEKEPRTFLGRLRELGYALNGVRPTQRSLRGIVNNIYDNFNPEPPVPPIPENAIFGISGFNNSNPTFTRTDDAVNLTYTKNDDGTITSDFDNYFPYKEMKRETINGNVFVKIPSMWFRVGTDESQNITDIAVSNEKGEGDNWYQTKEFYYGAYKGNLDDETGKLLSSTSYGLLKRDTIANLRAGAELNGEGYQQLDLYHKTIMNFLFLIEFAVKNVNVEFPTTIGWYAIGETDSITTPSGLLESRRIKWHYIEDFFGNKINEWLEGLKGNYYASSDVTKYESRDFELLSYKDIKTNSGIVSIGWDSNNPFLVVPSVTGSTTLYGGTATATIKPEQMAYKCGGSGSIGLFGVTYELMDKEYENSGCARLLYCPNGV